MNKLIYDIGMHVGQDTNYYLKEGYRVLAIEASPILAENAKKKFNKHIVSGQLTILNVGINNSETKLPFYINKRLSEWSSFDKSLGSRNGTEFDVVEIQCTSTKKLFEQYGIPYYLKVDIEGYDHLCLSDLPDTGEKPQYVSCEAGSLEWLDILLAKGYKKFKIISQGDNYIPMNIKKEKNPYYPRYQIIKNGIKLRLQKIISFKHMYGSTGPFGEKTKGVWLSYDETKKLYNEFYIDSGKPLNKVSWFDFHASL